MKSTLKVKSGLKGFKDLLSFLRLAGHQIIRMEHEHEWEILTVVRGQNDNRDWYNTFVARGMN